MIDRDFFFLTRNLDERAFKQGNQYDQFWRQRCRNYCVLLVRKLYNYRIPANARFIAQTCVKVGKVTVPQRVNNRLVNRRVEMHQRTFKITMKFARNDDLQYDVDFDQFNQVDRNGQYVRIDDITATPYD